MYQAFISYSSKDQPKVMNLCALLEKNQISCWIAPRNIPIGSNYAQAIPAAISSCPVYIILITTNAQNSQFVLKELEFAASSGKLIIPVLLENCPLTDAFRFLVGIEQHLPAYQMSENAIIQAIVQRILHPDEPIVKGSAGGYTQMGTVNLTIIRENQFYIGDTPVKVTTSNGVTNVLKKNSRVTISLRAGEQYILFTGSFRKTKIKIKLVEDTTLFVKWNRWNGHIDLETLSQTDMTVIESK